MPTECGEVRPVAAPPRPRRGGRRHLPGRVQRRVARVHIPRIHQAVIAALNPRMVLVTRDQQECAAFAKDVDWRYSWRHANAGNLSALIDGIPENQVEVGARRNQRVQIDDGAVLPEKSRVLKNQATPERVAHHLAAPIDRPRLAVTVAFDVAEISGYAFAPEIRIVNFIREHSRSDDFSQIVHAVRTDWHA